MLSSQKKQETLKFLIFSMGNLNLAMGIDSVIRIIPLPTIHRSGNKLLGITTYEDQEVLVIELYKRIYGQESSIDNGFLVIFAGIRSLYGSTIASLPNVQDVPVNNLQPVPLEYRARSTSGMDRYMNQVPLKKQEKFATVFLI